MTVDSFLPIFVYGTLQRGQCRASSWPHAPLKVVPAATQGRLVDLGAYPGLLDGRHKVQGELWYIAEHDFIHTVQVLDFIEGFQRRDNDLYERRIVACIVHPSGDRILAHAYFYKHAHENIIEVCPNEEGEVSWEP